MDILSLIHQKSYFWIAIVLIINCCNWFIYFKLSFKIIGEKIPLLRMSLATLTMVVFVLSARPFIPKIIFLLLLCATMVFLLAVFGRLNLCKSIYSAIFTIFISFLGNVFLMFTLLGLFPNLFHFVFETRAGFLIGSFMEVVFPLIALTPIPKLSLRLPLRRASEPFDLFDLSVSWILVCMYYIMDFALIYAYESFKSNPQKIGSSLGLLFMASFGIMSGVYLLIKCMKYMHDTEIRILTAEKEKVEREKERLAQEKGQVEEEKEQVEAKNMDLQEQMYTILDLNATLDPNVKKTIVDSFIALYKEGIKKSSMPKPPFIINQSKMAEYGIEERDSKILAHLVLHKSNQEIASALDYTEGHIANSLTEMYKKLNVKGRHQLIRFALKNKLIEIP